MNYPKLILVCFFTICLSSVFAQQNYLASSNLYELQFTSNEIPIKLGQTTFLSPQKINGDGRGMRNAGIILTVGGAAMLGGGYAIARYRTRNLDLFGDGNDFVLPGLGIAMILNSVGLLVPGIILTVKGAKKYSNGGGSGGGSLSFKTTGDSVGLQYTF